MPDRYQPRLRIKWLAYGLNPTLTGIERVVVELAHDFSQTELARHSDVQIYVDDDSDWAHRLTLPVVMVPRRRGALMRQPYGRRGLRECPDILHSFGPPLVGPAKLRIFTLFDWSPFVRASALSLKTRVAWGSAVISNLLRTDHIVTLNPAIRSGAPIPLRRLGDWTTYLPATSLLGEVHGSIPVRQPYVLCVGSNRPHKRLDLAVRAAAYLSSGILIGVGAGTDQLGGPGYVGLGRLPDSDVAMLYRGCAGAALVSQFEGLGLGVRDAAAFGKVTVVTPNLTHLQPPELSHCLWPADPTPKSLAAVFEVVLKTRPTVEAVHGPVGSPPWSLYRAPCEGA